MKITHFGHSAFLIEDLLIDPFITGNTQCKANAEDIACKIICVTHDHPDHIGDTIDIAKRNDATVVAVHELALGLQKEGVKTEGMNIGGMIEIGDWKIKMVKAEHSADVGRAAGLVLANSQYDKTVYHAGDTGLFGDMVLIGEEGTHIAILPIGGRYTMDETDALRAVDLLQPEIVIPMHYNTFPGIEADAEEFARQCVVPVEIFHCGEEKEV